MLANWNFKDEAANSTTQQINRQKSARNLEVIEFDASEPRAVFFDPKQGTSCDDDTRNPHHPLDIIPNPASVTPAIETLTH